jgi:SAM-dependent methyltransferase
VQKAVVDEARLQDFVGRMLGDMGAAINASLVQVGDRLGLWRALAGGDGLTAGELARRTGTNERMVREWLAAQVASGYVTWTEADDRYALSPEQAMVFADADSPVFLAGFFDVCAATWRSGERIEAAFRTGRGMGWDEHHPCLFCGTARFFRTSYRHHLVQDWIPALDGVAAKLERGASVADVGCGQGASTIVMAQAFPNSRFVGFDSHGPSIEAARAAAQEAGVADRVRFQVASAQQYPSEQIDFVTFFDCLHDMGDPAGAARHVRSTLKPDGTWMVVEPMAGDRMADNLNPVGRVYYAASTMICTPASQSQAVGAALGAQAGEARLTRVIRDGGFSRIRRAAETPFNMVLEARP